MTIPTPPFSQVLGMKGGSGVVSAARALRPLILPPSAKVSHTHVTSSGIVCKRVSCVADLLCAYLSYAPHANAMHNRAATNGPSQA